MDIRIDLLPSKFRNPGTEAMELCCLLNRKSDTVLEFRRGRPLVQIQPVPREAYARQTMHAMSTVHGIASLSEADWQRFVQTLSMRNGPEASVGSYKREVRARARTRNEGPQH